MPVNMTRETCTDLTLCAHLANTGGFPEAAALDSLLNPSHPLLPAAANVSVVHAADTIIPYKHYGHCEAARHETNAHPCYTKRREQ